MITTGRFFIFVGRDESTEFDMCTAPNWRAITAAAAGAPPALRFRRFVRTFRFRALGGASVCTDAPTPYSFPSEGVPLPAYTVAYINSIGRHEGGSWRMLTCVCAVCIVGGSSDRCVAWGAGHQPPRWWPYTLGTQPSDSWLKGWIRMQFPIQLPLPSDAVLDAEDLEAFFLSIESFLWRVDRYSGHRREPKAMVASQFRGVVWVQDWLGAKVNTLPPNQLPYYKLYWRLQLEKVGWLPPRAWTPVGGQVGTQYSTSDLINSI